MREIKFRAWRGGEAQYFAYSSISLSSIYDGDYPKSDPKELVWMLFTGLHDKNGKEIYERDILKAEDDEKPVVVEWLTDRNGWSFNQEFVNGGAPRQQAEVIGNPFENPELLA
jgi:YopX protein